MNENHDGAAGRRTFRAVIERLGRDERQRVVPLPVTLAAILFPFLAAWAMGESGMEGAGEPSLPGAESSSARAALCRTERAPLEANGYVDVHGPPADWECEVLERRGYVAPPASAQCPAHAGSESK